MRGMQCAACDARHAMPKNRSLQKMEVIPVPRRRRGLETLLTRLAWSPPVIPRSCAGRKKDLVD